MNTTAQQPIESSASSKKMLIAMVGIGMICALLIVTTYESTLPRINRLKAEALNKAIFEVIPGISNLETFKLLPDNTFVSTDTDSKDHELVYAGYDASGQLIGIAIPASGIGYADKISILYGFDPYQQSIIGFHVLESKETPGLGDKIEKDPEFLKNFNGLDARVSDDMKTMAHKITTVKKGQKENPWEIDGITGATISSRAIGQILLNSTNQIIPILLSQLDTFEKIKQEVKNE